MKRKLLILLALLVAAAIGLWIYATAETAELSVEAVMGDKPQLTEPRERMIPTINVVDPLGWAEGKTPTPAAGLAVNSFADKLDHPRWMTVLSNGDVLVAETNSPPRKGPGGIQGFVMGILFKKVGAATPSANRITLLRDADGDGVAEFRSTLIAGLNSPFGMAVVGDRLYIANTDAVVRVPFTVGETKISAKPEVVAKLPGGANHWARNLIADPKGEKLYVTVGSASNIGEQGMEAEAGRAAVQEIDLATGRKRIFAYGLRNPNGLAWEPVSGMLWTTVNERDMIGSDMVPDYLTSVQFGGFYGWPWYYWGGYVDKRVPEAADDDREYVIRPDYALGPHTASLGLAFAHDPAAPAKLGPRFAQGAFIAQHGSWNRRPLSGYKVIYVPFAKGRPAGKPIDVLTGFLDGTPESPKGAFGRPTGAVIDRAGALLVTDDTGNRIWRVSAAR